MAFGGGKVILLGEHAVVYGRPALAAGLGRGVRATATPAPDGSAAVRVAIAPWGITVETGRASNVPDDLTAEALEALLEARGLPRRPLSVEATVELPAGAGLGCSAALGVAVLDALDEAEGVTRDDGERAAISLAWERVFHGNPSGIDNAMAASGGVALYRKGEPLEPVHPRVPLRLVVGHSGEPGSTKETVSRVGQQHARDPARTEKVFDAIAGIVTNGRQAVEEGDLPALGQLMDVNQSLLSSLLVSTPRLEALCRVARDAGALGAKLTGGGGGGCMIALVGDDGDGDRVREALEAEDAEAFVAEAGAERTER